MSLFVRHCSVLLAATVCVVAALVGTGAATTQATAATRRPAPVERRVEPALIGTDEFKPGEPYSGDFPDPTILRVGGVYYAYSTTIASLNLPMMTSRNLKTWTARPTTGKGNQATNDAMPRAASWSRAKKVDGHYFSTTWAPSVAHIGKTYVDAYATTTVTRPVGTMCISVATSSSPMGPFVDRSTHALVCPSNQGAIDPQIFTDLNGAHWLLYKTEGVPGVVPARLWVRRLNATATAFRPDTFSRLLLQVQAPWEGTTIENPAMIVSGDRYYLFYSGGNYTNDTYATGYAVCAAVRGPCVRSATNPLLASGGDIAGPGGAMPFRDALGVLHLAYAAWTMGNTGYATSAACLHTAAGCPQRRMHIATLGNVLGTLEVLNLG